MGNRQLDPTKRKVKPAADVQGMRLFDPLTFQPALDLKVGDRGRAGALGNRDCIADMIAMPVRNEYVIGFHLISAHVGKGIAAQERIDQELGIPHGNAKARVTVIRNPHNRHFLTS